MRLNQIRNSRPDNWNCLLESIFITTSTPSHPTPRHIRPRPSNKPRTCIVRIRPRFPLTLSEIETRASRQSNQSFTCKYRSHRSDFAIHRLSPSARPCSILARHLGSFLDCRYSRETSAPTETDWIVGITANIPYVYSFRLTLALRLVFHFLFCAATPTLEPPDPVTQLMRATYYARSTSSVVLFASSLW